MLEAVLPHPSQSLWVCHPNVSLGLVPIGRQSQRARARNAIPITTRVYPRRMLIRWQRARSGSSLHVDKPHGGGVAWWDRILVAIPGPTQTSCVEAYWNNDVAPRERAAWW